MASETKTKIGRGFHYMVICFGLLSLIFSGVAIINSAKIESKCNAAWEEAIKESGCFPSNNLMFPKLNLTDKLKVEDDPR